MWLLIWPQGVLSFVLLPLWVSVNPQIVAVFKVGVRIYLLLEIVAWEYIALLDRIGNGLL